jgi:lysophospholipase L1-like esterase
VPDTKPALNRRVAGLILILISLFLGGLVGEGIIRLAAATLPPIKAMYKGTDPTGVLVEPHGELGYRQKPRSTFAYANGTSATSNTMGFRGPVVSEPKPAGTYRIILLGGSTTHGWGVGDDSTIDAAMRRILAGRFPDRRFEVVNLGFDGYDSWQDFERMRSDGVPLQPDLVILNSGINDVRNARYPNLVDKDPRTILWASVMTRLREDQKRGRPTIWTLVKHYSYLARLPWLLRSNLGARAVPKGAAPVQSYPEAAGYFQRNVERIAAITAGKGIPLLLSTPPSSLKLPGHHELTSDRTYWVGNDSATQAYRDELDRRLRLVADSLKAASAPAAYVPHQFSLDLFLDDCHLVPAGNAKLAEELVAAAEPFFTAKH